MSLRSVSSSSSASSSTSSFSASGISSPLGALHHASAGAHSDSALSSLAARLVPKSLLARRIAKAEEQAARAVEKEQRRASPREAKFVEMEREWKRDAARDAEARIVDGMRMLGM